MRGLIVQLLELVRVVSGFAVLVYLVSAIAYGFGGDWLGALVRALIGLAVFLVVSIFYSIAMTWARGEPGFRSKA